MPLPGMPEIGSRNLLAAYAVHAVASKVKEIDPEIRVSRQSLEALIKSRGLR